MSGLPPISASALHAMQDGFARLNKAAAEITSAGVNDYAAPADIVESQAQVTDMMDPLLAGIRDLTLAKFQVRTGAVLLRALRRQSGNLLDVLA